jgi:uncharacterized DUF497 family protein
MIDDEFEWDDAKAARNFRIHGVTFETAREALHDRFVFAWLDTSERYDEDRYRAIGMFQNRLIYVAFTERNGRTRIISARKPEPWERRRYHEAREQKENG